MQCWWVPARILLYCRRSSFAQPSLPGPEGLGSDVQGLEFKMRVQG